MVNSMTVKIYHNPRCTKSRETLALLHEHGIEPEVIEYLQYPPTVEELESILEKLGKFPSEIIRSEEPEYKELGLFTAHYSQEGLLALMVKHPKLIQRPIVVNGEKAAIGRPPEAVLEIL